jgi:predicted PurR-regulated permease PerM
MDSSDTDQPTPGKSPPWARTTKLIVIISTLALLVVAFYSFRGLVRHVVIAGILAYILTPLINYITRHTPIKRGLAVMSVYLLLAITVVTLLVLLGIETANQVSGLIQDLPDIVDKLTRDFLAIEFEPIVIGPFEIDLWTIDLVALRDQVVGVVRGLVVPSSEIVAGLAAGTVSTFLNIIFIFIISIYIAVDMPRFGGLIADLATRPGYRHDAQILTGQFSRIWRAYLRGQVILALVIGALVATSMTLLGLKNAIAIGVIAGLLEFLPLIGPLTAGVIAVLVALLQTNTPFGLSPVMYAAIVLAVMIVIQQVENNVLVPRIVGGALDLHPLIVIVGVLAGTSVAGVLGAILAAPVLATIKLVGTYGWYKLFDLEPFSNWDPGPESPPPSLRERTGKFFGRKSGESNPQGD